MGSLQQGGSRDDVNDGYYVGQTVVVGTSQVEAKVGANRDAARQIIIVYNDSNSTVYHGPSGVTTTGANKGIPIERKQTVAIPAGNVAVYLIADTAGNNVIVQEFG